ncbi:GGDEF domain-containing protein [Halopseudomonas maritima]|uniref:GGDEF domain-containing protein n=1 Tax=Halopseudomonas maritima TaxID=2918528 RepID=UPI001EECC5C3|nr:GGDEF domain-containing protein [Halopseudomonas maritima]UJJ33213.1 GGDEF domain-containing protein [Halopseudomonas maritima]
MEQLYFSPMLLGICLLGAIALCATALYCTVPNEPGPGFWLAGSWSLIGGIALFLVFVVTRNPVLNVLGNALQLAGEALFLLGVFRFLGQRLPWWILPISTGTMVAFNSWYWIANGSSDLLIGVYSSIAGLLPIQAIVLLLRESRDPATRPARLLVAVGLLIYSSVTLLRGYLGYQDWWHDEPYVQPYESFSYLLPYNFAIPALVLGFVGCCLMSTQRVLARSQHLAEQLREQTIRDPLTGAFNRRAFHRQLADEVARSQRYQRSLCLAMLDLDHFKQLNDQLGHQAGDNALQHFANLCQQQARHSDLFARFGGEEFVLLMPETRPDQAIAILERMRQQLASQPFRYQQHIYPLAVSIGVSQLAAEGSADQLLRQADLALYEAKNQGRNQVRLWSASPSVAY